MSRTYKDIPDWVKVSKEQTHVTWKHNPYLIGKTFYRTIPLKDGNGYQVWELGVWTDYKTVYEWVNGKEHTRWVTVEKEAWVPKYVKVPTRRYKNYCTCGENPSKSGNLLNPCKKQLTTAVEKSWYQKQFYKEDHPGDRKNTRKTLKQAANAYNTNFDTAFDTDEYENVYNIKPPLEWVH